MSRGLRIVLVLSLVLNVVALGVGGYYVHSHGIAEIEQKLGLAAAPRPPFAQLGHQRFGALPGAAVTFVGDSEVQNAPLGELAGESANRGIGGQTIADVGSWLDVPLGRPELRHLVVWAGTNDVLLGHGSDQAGKDMAALLAAVKQRRPDVTVTVLGLPPLRDHRPEAAAVDTVLQVAAQRAGDRFLPVASLLTAPGSIDAADGVHLTPAGYAAIGPVLRQAAG